MNIGKGAYWFLSHPGQDHSSPLPIGQEALIDLDENISLVLPQNVDIYIHSVYSIFQ